MTTLLVNEQECSTGLVLDGHFGWHNHVRMLQTAEGLGWEIDDELQAVMDLYDSGDYDYDSNIPEIIFDAMQEAENWLNDRTDDGFVWHWHDGEFFLSPLCENGDCNDDTCAHWD
jgi:hypothetical protein